VASLVRSTVVANDDFGIRSMLIAQFFLLLLGVVWWEGGFGSGESGRPMRRAMLAMAFIGLAGTVYQVATLRFYLPVEERLGRAEVSGLAERAMATRLGFAAMDARVAKDAVVQFNTAQPGEFFGYAQVMQAGRQMASGLPVCGAAFGGDVGGCGGVERGVARLFSRDGAGALSAEEVRAECGRLGVSDLVATRWDAVWADRRGWVWGLPAVVDSDEVRVLDCAAAKH